MNHGFACSEGTVAVNTATRPVSTQPCSASYLMRHKALAPKELEVSDGLRRFPAASAELFRVAPIVMQRVCTEGSFKTLPSEQLESELDDTSRNYSSPLTAQSYTGLLRHKSYFV